MKDVSNRDDMVMKLCQYAQEELELARKSSGAQRRFHVARAKAFMTAAFQAYEGDA